MNKLQEQILYSNGKESKEETRLAKNRLRKERIKRLKFE